VRPASGGKAGAGRAGRVGRTSGSGGVRGHFYTLADHGVLILDELSEFALNALAALRQPLW